MPSYQKLTAEDGFSLSAFRTDPEGPVRGGVVVLQEVFGVNAHIRSICTRLSAAGYVALAPALFDRLQPNFESGYEGQDNINARAMVNKVNWSDVRKDAQVAIETLQAEGPVAVLGFCFGGTVAYGAATRIPGLAACIAYYGGGIVKYADKPAGCPTQLHFGLFDTHIPQSDVAEIHLKRPEIDIFTYPANHGFNCDVREAFDGESAAISWGRTIEFLGRHLSRT